MTGTLIISIDLELAWGTCDRPLTQAQRAALDKERAIVHRLLALFESHDIRATWHTVGHLILSSCSFVNDTVHPEIPRPMSHRQGRDWFFQHPPTDSPCDRLWYGRDLIQALRDAVPPQEIGSHSFCHLVFDPAATPRAAAWADLSTAGRVHRENALPFESFAFPRNMVGYRDLLAAVGLRVYRGRTPHWYDRIPIRRLRRLAQLLVYLMPGAPPTVRPSLDEYGLLNIPDSLLFTGRAGVRSIVSGRRLAKKCVAGLHRAVRRGEIFHLWFHPSNFAARTDEQFAAFDLILQHAGRLRSQGRLEVKTMGDYLRDRSSVEPPRDAAHDVIRRQAIECHDVGAPRFRRLYDEAEHDRYSSSFSYGRLYIGERLFDELRSLPSDARVLDVGCGTGDQLEQCLALGLTAKGIEPSARMRQMARARFPQLDIQDGVISALPFPDRHFDFVFAIEVLRYMDPRDIAAGYREVLRVLKPGGRFFFTMVNRWALDGFALYYHAERWITPLRKLLTPVHCEFTTPTALRRSLREAGLEPLTVTGGGVLPVRLAYKAHPDLGRQIARVLHPLDAWLSTQRWTVLLAGHLMALAARPAATESRLGHGCPPDRTLPRHVVAARVTEPA